MFYFTVCIFIAMSHICTLCKIGQILDHLCDAVTVYHRTIINICVKIIKNKTDPEDELRKALRDQECEVSVRFR